MARPTDRQIFLSCVEEAGGRVSNGQLQGMVGWASEKYWRIHGELFEAGEIEKGRGYGGTVLLAKASEEADADSVHSGSARPEIIQICEAPDPYRVTPELELYEPALGQLRDNWCKRRQLDDCHCEIVALQGRRETGGSWSRPDIAVIGYRKYEFLPERVFELHTFELKAASDVSIKGVLEALAHREAATRSYVLYHTAGKDLDDFPESSRIEELASR